MSQDTETRPALKSMKKLGELRPRAVAVSSGELVREGRLSEERALPALFRPLAEGVDLAAWCREHRDRIEQRLVDEGAILFRGFDVRSPEQFEGVIEAVSGELLEYRERSTPRHQVHHNVYTSTDYPADQAIFPHNENSYQHAFPLKLFFYCHVAPEVGGETPIVDVRAVGRRIPEDVRRRFAERGILYVRNFGNGLGLDWRSVFQTEDRAAVEAYCQRVNMRFEWREGDRLRVKRVLPATVRHPRTNEEVWFNHGTFFHVTTLPDALREPLQATFAEEDLPNHTYYGDGSPIEPEVVAELRRIYLDEKVIFPWQRGDVLLVDNVLTAHAREPYRGRREILTGMAEPTTRVAP